MKITKDHMLLYAVTGRSWSGTKTLKEQVESALKGGITCLQLREKGLSRDAFIQEAKEIKSLTDQYGVPLIINDDVQVALACDADGVHVGQKDMRADQVRKLLGSDKVIGVSARTVQQAVLAQELGADYLGTGAVFGTSTKEDARRIERKTVQNITRSVAIPVVAIGGINRRNLPLLAGSGVDGTALVSAIFAEEDIEQTVRSLKRLAIDMVEAGRG